MRLFGRKPPEGDLTLSLYYASDVHGSEQCWRKFLGAARYYKVQALIMGGDLTGKAIVPIERSNGHFRATFLGEVHEGSDAEQAELVQSVRYNGMYPWVAAPEEVARMRADDRAREELFESVMLDEVRRWISLADERMAPQGIDVLVMAGNDDPWSVDEVLEQASHVRACDDRVVRLGAHEMISCSYANPTPWDSPRELDEDQLYTRIKRLADRLEAPERAIFNLHVPPYDTPLDRAPEIEADTLKLVYRGGQPCIMSVGSKAVRQLIEEYQPLLALHGHIHESRGEVRIGRTLAINTGSEYNSGRIHGAIVKLAGDQVVSHQFVVG